MKPFGGLGMSGEEESTVVGFMVAANPGTELIVSPFIGYWITKWVGTL